MKKCPSIQSDLVAYLSEELEESEREEIRAHLETCPACRHELAGLEPVLREAQALEPEIEKVMESVDWDARADDITTAVWTAQGTRRAQPARPRFRLFAPAFRPVLAGLVFGVVVGALATFLVFRGKSVRQAGGERYFASPEFLERVDLEIARRDTLDYLDKSQYLLLDIVGSDEGASRAAADQARELLAKKKYLNPELEKARMAKAKTICDQIEVLFYQLADVTSGPTAAERAELKDLIKEKDIFLKIRLLKRELQESEV
jgi:hypothetical protein